MVAVPLLLLVKVKPAGRGLASPVASAMRTADSGVPVAVMVNELLTETENVALAGLVNIGA